MVSTDSCLAVSMKEQVLTTRISASSGREVRRAPPRSRRPIMTSESNRFLGQPNETKPTVGAVGWQDLLTALLYPHVCFAAGAVRLDEHLQNPTEPNRSFGTQDFLVGLNGVPAASRTPLASAENG